MDAVNDDLMLTAAVARALKCTPDGVRYLHRAGKLPVAMRVGGVRLFRRSDVERFRLEREQEEARQQSSEPASAP